MEKVFWEDCAGWKGGEYLRKGGSSKHMRYIEAHQTPQKLAVSSSSLKLDVNFFGSHQQRDDMGEIPMTPPSTVSHPPPSRRVAGQTLSGPPRTAGSGPYVVGQGPDLGKTTTLGQTEQTTYKGGRPTSVKGALGIDQESQGFHSAQLAGQTSRSGGVVFGRLSLAPVLWFVFGEGRGFRELSFAEGQRYP